MAKKVDEHFPEIYFTNMMIEKANIIKNHLHKSVHPLIKVANIGPTMAVFKFYDTMKGDDSLKLCMTLSNLGDLHDQICILLYPLMTNKATILMFQHPKLYTLLTCIMTYLHISTCSLYTAICQRKVYIYAFHL